MDIKELDRLARENRTMPDRLAMHEQCYYISSRGLYQQYQAGYITLEEAKREKEQVIKSYELAKEQWQLFIGLFEVQEKLKQLREDQFNTALEIEILELLDKML